jgi:mitogen-activated protein kinase kinase kinase
MILNIDLLLSTDGMLKFVDFGAAYVRPVALASSSSAPASRIRDPRAGEGDFAGTPMYLAPEVVRHEAEGAFGARDIWAVGCVVLELLTGRKPWDGFDNEWFVRRLSYKNVPLLTD